MNLVPQQYWDKGYENLTLDIAPKDDMVRQWIESFFCRKNEGRCLEIGCFPGRYLAVFGELGYELNGIDLTPRVDADLPTWLRLQNYKVGNFVNINFRDYKPQEKFDVVSSFGYIEHFVNWKEILKQQAMLVKEDGYLVVETPNFYGLIQRVLHVLFDNNNYKRHNILSMNPTLWSREAQTLNFEIIYCGAFGAFDFWFESQERNYLQRKLLDKMIKHLFPCIKKLPKDNRAYSPYCGLIARKKSIVK